MAPAASTAGLNKKMWATLCIFALIVGSAVTKKNIFPSAVRATPSKAVESATCYGLCRVLGAVVAAVPVVPSQRPMAENITEYFKSRARFSRDRLATERRPKPTPQMPFVFMHQRKAGGSSMRSMLANAARQNNLTYWIPCHNIGCEVYDPPVDGTAKKFAVFGAHIYWPAVEKALATARAKRPHLGSNAPFDCYTSFREPVSRVASCWDYRGFRAFAGDNVSAISPAKFREYLAEGMSPYDEGCNNEPLRLLSDSGRAEEKVNKLTSGTGGEPWRDADGWALDAVATLERTLAHLTEHCVVGVLERCEDTKASVEFFFPWLAASFDCGVHLNGHSGSAHSDLTRAEEAEIKRQNQLEYMAYDVANRLLDAQLEVVAAARRPA